ncbi:DUF6199 family natural product biosynthesis protein [Paucisalibacillus globulus]|uniref:DUF6199 family natural product biosynthesis protein n=1 Tax=Paucisalibacillus globulus TaxID=351095 RepID=UPI00040B22A9|nr:DUF6199 family natural product biosynthesis protein [Paucisalibacillus globulus]
MLVVGMFLVGFGLFMILKPTLFWVITESWKSNDGTEPSDFYINSTRFGGVMFVLGGFSGMIGSIL